MKKYFSIITLSLLLVTGGCINGFIGVSGDGNVVKEERNIASFEAIDASGGLTLVLVNNSANTVEVTADQNLMPNIETYVRGNTLHVDTKNIRNATELEVRINYETIRHMDLSGAVDISAINTLKADKLTLEASGASEIILYLEVETLTVDVSGASEITLSGRAENADYDGSGASSLNALELITNVASISISGAGEARIHASEKLSAKVSGAGSIRYTGNPTKINKSISGAGSITKR